MVFSPKKTTNNSYFGNFVINIYTKLPKIGNFVSKNRVFKLVFGLGKEFDYSELSKRNERTTETEILDCFVPRNDAKRQTIKRLNIKQSIIKKIGDQNHVSN